MKIALVLNSDVTYGGANTYEKSLTNFVDQICSQENFELSVFIPYKNKNNKSDKLGFQLISYNFGFLDKLRLALRNSIIYKLAASRAGIQKSNFEKFLENQKFDLIHFGSPNPLAQIIREIPFITTVWDLGHRNLPEFPEMSRDGQWEDRETYFQESIPKSFHIFTDSEQTNSQIVQIYGVDKSRVSNLGLLPDIPFMAPTSTESHLIETYGDYFIYPAHKWPHKNHRVLIDALSILKEKGRFPKVIFTGLDKGNGDFICNYSKNLGLENQIIDLGFTSFEHLTELIQGSKGLLMPSLLGPTNIPPLEAMMLGIPSLVSDVHHFDFYEDSLITFIPGNKPNLWANEMVNLLTKNHQNIKYDPTSELQKAEQMIRIVYERFNDRMKLWK